MHGCHVALVHPVDRQLWLQQRAQRAGCSIEDIPVGGLYEAQRRDQHDEIALLRASGDVWAGVKWQVTVKTDWQKRHPGKPEAGRKPAEQMRRVGSRALSRSQRLTMTPAVPLTTSAHDSGMLSSASVRVVTVLSGVSASIMSRFMAIS